MRQISNVYIGVIFIFIIVCFYNFVECPNLHRNLVLFIFGSIVLLSKITLKWNHSFMLFLGAFFLFIISRVLLDFLTFRDIAESDKYVFYTISSSTLKKVYTMISLSLVGIFIGVNSIKHIPNTNQNLKLQNEDIIYKVILAILFISIPGTILKFIYDLMMIKTHGFLILYTGMPKANFFFRFSWLLFNITFPLLFIRTPNLKHFRILIVIFFLTSIFDFAKGNRGALARPIVFFIWYYYKFYKSSGLKISSVLKVVVPFLIISEIMLFARHNADFNFDFSAIFILFFDKQGVTFDFLANYIDFKDRIINPSNYYIFSPIIDSVKWFINPIYAQGHSSDLVNITLNLDHKIMYAVNPEAYLQGAGYGSSFMIELYALGGWAILLIGTILLGSLIVSFENNVKNSYLLGIFSWYWIFNLAWCSRGNYFPDLLTFSFSLTILMLAKCVAHLYMNLKNKKSHEILSVDFRILQRES